MRIQNKSKVQKDDELIKYLDELTSYLMRMKFQQRIDDSIYQTYRMTNYTLNEYALPQLSRRMFPKSEKIL